MLQEENKVCLYQKDNELKKKPLTSQSKSRFKKAYEEAKKYNEDAIHLYSRVQLLRTAEQRNISKSKIYESNSRKLALTKENKYLHMMVQSQHKSEIEEMEKKQREQIEMQKQKIKEYQNQQELIKIQMNEKKEKSIKDYKLQMKSRYEKISEEIMNEKKLLYQEMKIQEQKRKEQKHQFIIKQKQLSRDNYLKKVNEENRKLHEEEEKLKQLSQTEQELNEKLKLTKQQISSSSQRFRVIQIKPPEEIFIHTTIT